jgi:hypothetical protein
LRPQIQLRPGFFPSGKQHLNLWHHDPGNEPAPHHSKDKFVHEKIVHLFRNGMVSCAVMDPVISSLVRTDDESKGQATLKEVESEGKLTRCGLEYQVATSTSNNRLLSYLSMQFLTSRSLNFEETTLTKIDLQIFFLKCCRGLELMGGDPAVIKHNQFRVYVHSLRI